MSETVTLTQINEPIVIMLNVCGISQRQGREEIEIYQVIAPVSTVYKTNVSIISFILIR